MPNTNMEKLYPEFWAMGWDEIDMGQYNLHNMVSKDVSTDVQKAGTTVDVMLQPDLGDPETYDGVTVTTKDISQESVKITLDKGKQKTITLSSKELSLSPYDLIKNYAAPMAKSIISQLSKDVYAELIGSKYFVDATAGLSESLLIDAGTMLSDHDVDDSSRQLACSPAAYGALLKIANLSAADGTGDGGAARRDGQLFNRYGFNIGKDNGIKKYTPYDVAGAVNNSGTAYAPGATTIAVDAFNDDSNPIRIGDMFKIADETGTPFHTVISTKVTSSDTTEITFYPALKDGAADNAVVTVTPTQSALAFTPSACGLAMRAWAELPEGLAVQSSVINANGIPVRISVWQSDLNIKIQYATLYGVKRYRDERIVSLVNVL